jgi:hypothetical protein
MTVHAEFSKQCIKVNDEKACGDFSTVCIAKFGCFD